MKLNFRNLIIVVLCLLTLASICKAGFGRNFWVYNDCPKTIKIEVGNYVPTPYTIPSHQSKWVYETGSDLQDIHISEVG